MNRILESLKFRLKLRKLGLKKNNRDVDQSLGYDRINFQGKKVPIIYSLNEKDILEYELFNILVSDCYKLELLHEEKINTVLDIGANVGFFSIAARLNFPKATIISYEPNPAIIKFLSTNSENWNFNYYNKAVGLTKGKISLKEEKDSLHSTTRLDGSGDVEQDSFSSIVNSMRQIDLIKLDAEGIEWELLEESDETWAKVKYVTMEYHLWAKPASSAEELTRLFKNKGFQLIGIEPSPNGPWGIAQFENSDHK